MMGQKFEVKILEDYTVQVSIDGHRVELSLADFAEILAKAFEEMVQREVELEDEAEREGRGVVKYYHEHMGNLAHSVRFYLKELADMVRKGMLGVAEELKQMYERILKDIEELKKR